jgi:hypothetical protein
MYAEALRARLPSFAMRGRVIQSICGATFSRFVGGGVVHASRWANTSVKSDMPNDPNPYESPKVREDGSAKHLSEGEQLEQNAIHLFASGLIGLFAPVCAVYGIVFLLRHKHQFPRKRLAIIGTVLNCLWTSIWCYWILFD